MTLNEKSKDTKKKKKKSNATVTNYFTTFLKTINVTNCWCGFSNFQIIIDKYKCNVSGRLILELIRICHINSL